NRRLQCGGHQSATLAEGSVSATTGKQSGRCTSAPELAGQCRLIGLPTAPAAAAETADGIESDERPPSHLRQLSGLRGTLRTSANKTGATAVHEHGCSYAPRLWHRRELCLLHSTSRQSLSLPETWLQYPD